MTDVASHPCPSCGFAAARTIRFCPKCGRSFDDADAGDLRASAPPGAMAAAAMTSELACFVGRGEGIAIRLDDPSVSTKHARLAVENGRLYIEDSNSKNGVFVAGIKVTRLAVWPGDHVLIGAAPLPWEHPVLRALASQVTSARSAPEATVPPPSKATITLDANGTPSKPDRRLYVAAALTSMLAVIGIGFGVHRATSARRAGSSTASSASSGPSAPSPSSARSQLQAGPVRPPSPSRPATAGPTETERLAAIAAWVNEPVRGRDHGLAPIRAVDIDGPESGSDASVRYTIFIESKFGFRCDLAFDARGVPVTMTRCRTQVANTHVNNRSVAVSCARADHRVLCNAEYELLVDPGLQERQFFQFSRARIDVDSATHLAGDSSDGLTSTQLP